jgi:hypothetical protein
MAVPRNAFPKALKRLYDWLDDELGGDPEQRLIACGSALTLTVAEHDGKTILLDTAAGSTATLPLATGSGARIKFQISTTATSNSHKIQVGDATDVMAGVIMALSDDTAAVKGWAAGATDDTITFNRTTTGLAKKGNWVEVEDVAENLWLVRGQIEQSGTEATPFSAAV